MSRSYITGVKELEATLQNLADKEADKIARSALGSGLSVIAKAQKKAAPVGKTGALRESIGKRLEKKKRSGIVVAKAGINVGKQSKKKPQKERAPHSHLVGLGTQIRKAWKGRKKIGGKFSYIKSPTERQRATGTMPANPFIKEASASSQSAVMEKMKKQGAKALARAVKRAKK